MSSSVDRAIAFEWLAMPFSSYALHNCCAPFDGICKKRLYRKVPILLVSCHECAVRAPDAALSSTKQLKPKLNKIFD